MRTHVHSSTSKGSSRHPRPRNPNPRAVGAQGADCTQRMRSASRRSCSMSAEQGNRISSSQPASANSPTACRTASSLVSAPANDLCGVVTEEPVVVVQVARGQLGRVRAEGEVAQRGQPRRPGPTGLGPGAAHPLGPLGGTAPGPPPPAIQPAPSCTVRRTAAAPMPPISSGGPPGCTGPGPIGPAMPRDAPPHTSAQLGELRVERRAPAVEVGAGRGVVVGPTADRDAHGQPAVGDAVHGGQLLGQQRAVAAERRDQDRR